jgi:uncharacterized RDD family membrane protein YckC
MPDGSDYAMASRLHRLLASLIDLLILALAVAPGVVVGVVSDSMRGESLANAGLLGTVVLQWSLICQTGQSFGKRLLGLKIVRLNGQPVDKVSGVAMRTYWVLGLLEWRYGLLLCLADVLAIVGTKRRCIHDFTAGTKVITVARPQRSPSNPTLQSDERVSRFAPSRVRR